MKYVKIIYSSLLSKNSERSKCAPASLRRLRILSLLMFVNVASYSICMLMFL